MNNKDTVYSIPSNEYILKIISDEYSINPIHTALYRNSGGMLYFVDTKKDKYVFKVYSSYDINDEIHMDAFRAKESFKIINHLNKNNFAVPNIVSTTDVKLCTSIPMAEGNAIGVLFEYISGKDVEFKDIENDIAETTSSMHTIMKSYPRKLTVLGKDFYIGRMMKIFHQYYKENSQIHELEAFGNYAFDKIRDLPKGFCHGDYGTHNIKKAKNKLYVYDFDAASGTYPMYDITLICDATNFWRFDAKDLNKTRENIYDFAEIYTKHCDLSQVEIDSYIYFLALRQYEVRATVAHNSIYKIGTHFLNENYLNSLHSWMSEFIKSVTD